MHAKWIACVFSASLVAAAPVAQSDPNAEVAPQVDFNGQPFNPDEFLQNFASFFPQMVEFFSNPENLQAISQPLFNVDGDAGVAGEENVVLPPEENFVPPPEENVVPPPEEEAPPPPPEEEDSGSDSGDESEDDGPSTAAQIGNFAGDAISGDDDTGDLIGAGIDLIGDIF